MIFIEKLNDLIEEATSQLEDLYEFAINRKKVKDKIIDWSDDIVDHACKIIYLKHIMPNTVHHWCSEINAKMQKIIEIQMKRGQLKSDTLLTWIRNGLTHSDEMKDRRCLVAMQEKININICKPWEENDYNLIIKILKELIDLVFVCRKQQRLSKVEDVMKIFYSIK